MRHIIGSQGVISKEGPNETVVEGKLLVGESDVMALLVELQQKVAELEAAKESVEKADDKPAAAKSKAKAKSED